MPADEQQSFSLSYDSATKIITAVVFAISDAYSPLGYAIRDGSIVIKRLAGSATLNMHLVHDKPQERGRPSFLAGLPQAGAAPEQRAAMEPRRTMIPIAAWVDAGKVTVVDINRDSEWFAWRSWFCCRPKGTVRHPQRFIDDLRQEWASQR